MKHMIALSFVALVVVAFAGCQNNGNKPQPAAPVAPAAPAVTDVSPESSGPTTITPEPPRSSSVRTPMPAPGSSAGMSGSGKTYTVQPHDTLYSISVKFYGSGKRVKDIADANGIADPSKISVGQVLKMP